MADQSPLFEKSRQAFLLRFRRNDFPRIYVSIADQRLILHSSAEDNRIFPISTGIRPPSNLSGSGGTPTGLHRICGKFGDLLPAGAILRGRRFVGKMAFQLSAEERRTAIASRILQLEGLEDGINRGQNTAGQCCDSRERLIYIHGIGDDNAIGFPSSHGCINMTNDDIIHIFNKVEIGTFVIIE